MRCLAALALACTLAAAHGATPAAALAPAPAAAPAAHPIPFKKEGSDTSDAAGKSLLALALIVGAAWGGVMLLKRTQPQWQRKLGLPGAAGRRLQLVETLRLSAKATLYLVELDDKTLLLAHSGERITVAAAEPGAAPTDEKEIDVAKHS